MAVMLIISRIPENLIYDGREKHCTKNHNKAFVTFTYCDTTFIKSLDIQMYNKYRLRRNCNELSNDNDMQVEEQKFYKEL